MPLIPQQPAHTILAEEPVTCDELQCLNRQLEKLVTIHYAALKEEQVLEPVETLLHWVEACQDGSKSAERHLFNEGTALLASVSERLKLALSEELRMMDESPTAAATARGRTAERYAKASTRSAEALNTLQALAEESA